MKTVYTFNNKVLKNIANYKWLVKDETPVPPDPYNPLNLPPNTIRLKYNEGVTPTFSKGTGVQVSQSPNVWDLTYNNTNWDGLLENHNDLIEVLGANTTGVTIMSLLFCYCENLEKVSLFDTSTVQGMSFMFWMCGNLTEVPLFDTSNVVHFENMFAGCSKLITVPHFDTSNGLLLEYMFSYCPSLTHVPLFNTENATACYQMFYDCSSLSSIPLFNTNKVTNMASMFDGCVNVVSGALALYQQASTQATPPTAHDNAFTNCGINTQTGSAELAQIPDDWK